MYFLSSMIVQSSVSCVFLKFYDCTKFRYSQVTGGKVINNQNFQIFFFVHLNLLCLKEPNITYCKSVSKLLSPGL